MNKNAIQSFTQWAKIQLTSAIKQKAFEYGITEKSIDESVSVVNGRVLSQIEQKQRETLITRIKEEGYNQIIEEVTYTWFNRFIALRFMEVNGYLPTRVRVFSDENNGFNPQILKEALTIELDNINRDLIIDYLDKNNTEDLYKYLLVSQCNALNKIIPVLFEKISNYSELLFPDNLLKKNSVIEHLVTDIPEDDWKEQVQILGWIYQFYVSGNREEFRKVKIVKKEHVPTLSQIFTPDWIVKYMTENSLGRLWLENNPNSSIKESMKYYVEDAKQEEEVQRKLDEIKYKNVNPEDIRIIEPCCGSGHILCYIFDLLYKIYEESGYRKSEIPTLILEKNIYGLDIDKRASQLAYFSLLMKARSVDSRFFSREKIAKPKVLEIVDSQNILDDDYLELMEKNNFSNNTMKTAKYLVETFKNAKVIGSLLRVDKLDYKSFIEELKIKRIDGPFDLFSTILYNDLIPEFIKLARLAIVLSKKYDVMITNPPYLGSSSLEQSCKDYANKHYPNSKSDMFTMFMEVPFVRKNGFRAIVNPDGWMFNQNFRTLRSEIIKQNYVLHSMIHIGNGAFDASVSTTTFIIKEICIMNYISKFLKLNNCIDDSIYYNVKLSSFKEIPEGCFIYWKSKKFISNFKKNKIEDYIFSDGQLKTGDNNKFLRFIWEIDFNSIGTNNKKWSLIAKGGPYRKWSGNIEYVIDWSDEAKKHYKEDKVARIPKEYIWFRKGVCWNHIGGTNFAARLLWDNCLFETAAPTVFFNDENVLFYSLGFLNSVVGAEYMNSINPTLSTNINNIANQPLIITNEKDEIIQYVKECIQISEFDWNLHETSFKFLKNPLVKNNDSLINIFNNYENFIMDKRKRLLFIEQKINEYFINIYGLQDELTPEVSDKDITIRIADSQREIRSLISYIVGLIMGRYSIDYEGVIYAGGIFDLNKYKTIIPDEDNIIPICDDEYFEDDLCARVIDSIKKIYGEDTLEENLQFIADALGGNGTSREIIRNYLLNDFYKDHLKIYQKRPIYWMLDSGKKNGFKGLIYMHRYTPDLLAKIRTDYVHEQQERYRTQIENLENEVLHLEGSNKLKAVKKLEKIKAQADELLVFEEKLHHLADQMISIDLDDGVVVNYAKFKEILYKIK